VTGNYTQSAAGNLTIEISSTQTSKLAVTGCPRPLNGNLTVVPTGTGYGSRTVYQILTATGGVTGTFASIAQRHDLDRLLVQRALPSPTRST